MELLNVVLAWIEKKFNYWITKPLSLEGKFYIYSKVLIAIHVSLLLLLGPFQSFIPQG